MQVWHELGELYLEAYSNYEADAMSAGYLLKSCPPVRDAAAGSVLL